MQNYYVESMIEGRRYIGTMSECGQWCSELVKVEVAPGIFDHLQDADFESVHLGSASRHTYLKAVVASAAYRHRREIERQERESR